MSEVAGAPGNRGLSPRITVLGERRGMREWECPYCSHSILYDPKDQEVVDLAAESHLSRQHKAKVFGGF